MKTPIVEALGAEFPIFAFSHCRDVVAAVTRAGGIGVLGASALSPDVLEVELQRLDEATRGLPYGVDLVVPATRSANLDELRSQLPQPHVAFVKELGDRFGIPPRGGGMGAREFGDHVWSPELAREQWERVRGHNAKLVVSALGPLPEDIVADAKTGGMLVGGMAGAPSHAVRHVEGGADFVVAQGTEAGGHTGDISTFVLVPQVVDAVGEVPVLAAGGIGSGRHVAAAFALGAAGVWTGSIWLTSSESNLHPAVVDKLLRAQSRDTIRSRARTGKPLRQLRTPWIDAWESPDAPSPLPSPLQRVLVLDQAQSIEEHGIIEPMGSAVGQIVGMMSQRRSCAQIVHGLVEQYVAVMESIATSD